MTRKNILPVALLLILSLLSGCGGGAGTSSEPVGVNESQPSIIQVLAVQHVAQTNSTILFKAKVLDGNGNAIPNVPVTFTNLSLVGVLSSTSAVTDSLGFAKVTLFSTDSGFATVQAEVNTGAGKVRDKKTVFFSIFDVTLVTVPTLALAVDNNNDGSFNDPGDFILFQTPGGTDQAIIRATVADSGGTLVVGDTVAFTADSTEATFPDGALKTTNADGQAFTRVKVVPTELRNITVPLNISATSLTTGAFNVITLFIGPITVNQVTVVADPLSIASGGTSQITAVVTTVGGSPVPDGTTVNFTTNKGSVTPFAQTTGGLATATFTAPTLAAGSANTAATITASAGGKSGSVNVTVTAAAAGPILVTPPSLTVVNTNFNVITFTITGGTGPFTVTSSDPLNACNDSNANNLCSDAGDSGIWTNVSSTFKVTVPASACPETVTLTITDTTGATKTATITIATANPLTITPVSASICENDTLCGAGTDTATFTVSGGTVPYAVTSSSIGVIPSPGNSSISPFVFTVNAANNSITADTTVTLTVTDKCSTSKTATVQVINQP